MTRHHAPAQDRPTRVRVLVAGAAGLAVAIILGLTAGWRYAPAGGWAIAAVVYTAWTWSAILGMNADDTAAHATRENPGRRMSDLLSLTACIASVGGVVYLLSAGSSGSSTAEAIAAGLGIASVVGAWFVVHTVFTLRYALLYYADEPGGIDFNQSEPATYADFAYLAFTLGMTYQVSDTDLQTRSIRSTALRHGLLSYLLGAVILATVINLVAGLGSNSGH
jgi:uncharacterized membrane protein